MDKKFDLFAHIMGADRPTDVVEIYTNERAAQKAWALIKFTEGNDPVPVGLIDPSTADEYAALQKEISDSSVKIHLRGIPAETHQSIKDGYLIDGESTKGYHVRLLEEMFVKAESASGQEDSTKRSFDEWLEFVGNLAESQWYKIQLAIDNLLLVNMVLDVTVDAPFLAKS
jgi:hypothetical protein